jgi:RNA polymerase sigma factor (TIGR02999 family)
MKDITDLLRAANRGDSKASGELFEVLYGDLKRLAHARLRDGNARGELETTALVHESFLRLADRGALAPSDRPSFFAYIGKVMRSVALDLFRERSAEKRGGDARFVTLTTGIAGERIDETRLCAIDDAMKSLARLSPELHALVEMRYFAGMSLAEVSEVTGRSVRTLEREWQKAIAFLRQILVES